MFQTGPVTYDFTSTHEKIIAARHADPPKPYDILQDREQLSTVISEITSKGLIPLESQIDFFSFAILWYYAATFFI